MSNTVNAYQQPSSIAQPVAQHVTNPNEHYNRNNASVQNPLLLQQQIPQMQQSMAAHNIIQPQPQHVHSRTAQDQQNLRTLQQQPPLPQQQQSQPLQSSQNRSFGHQKTDQGTTRNENVNLQQQQAAALNVILVNTVKPRFYNTPENLIL